MQRGKTETVLKDQMRRVKIGTGSEFLNFPLKGRRMNALNELNSNRWGADKHSLGLPYVYIFLSSQNKITPGKKNQKKKTFLSCKKCQTCAVVAKRTVTNNIYMEEVCISAASQSTARLSLHQSKNNEGSPHCNYPTMSLSVTSHTYE